MDEYKVQVVCLILIVLGMIGGYIFVSSQEAKTYNKLTGKNVSTWDAMWVELRVQDGVED